MKTLAILIPTLREREAMTVALCDNLITQIQDRNVKIVIDYTGREMTIGAKRQMMLEKITSDYIAFIDDDDEVSANYIQLIYDAIQSEPDVIGMRGWMTTNGTNRENWIIRTKYDWKTNVDGFRYVRYPNHLSPIKTELALEAGFPDLRHGEDYEYSMRLKAKGNLKNEVFIDEELYHYKFMPKK
jgi:hypothetical protein